MLWNGWKVSQKIIDMLKREQEPLHKLRITATFENIKSKERYQEFESVIELKYSKNKKFNYREHCNVIEKHLMEVLKELDCEIEKYGACIVITRIKEVPDEYKLGDTLKQVSNETTFRYDL